MDKTEEQIESLIAELEIELEEWKALHELEIKGWKAEYAHAEHLERWIERQEWEIGKLKEELRVRREGINETFACEG
jgi:predicted RNase H-like nuclease (RuvC/YqgF family)